MSKLWLTDSRKLWPCEICHGWNVSHLLAFSTKNEQNFQLFKSYFREYLGTLWHNKFRYLLGETSPCKFHRGWLQQPGTPEKLGLRSSFRRKGFWNAEYFKLDQSIVHIWYKDQTTEKLLSQNELFLRTRYKSALQVSYTQHELIRLHIRKMEERKYECFSMWKSSLVCFKPGNRTAFRWWDNLLCKSQKGWKIHVPMWKKGRKVFL